MYTLTENTGAAVWLLWYEAVEHWRLIHQLVPIVKIGCSTRWASKERQADGQVPLIRKKNIHWKGKSICWPHIHSPLWKIFLKKNIIHLFSCSRSPITYSIIEDWFNLHTQNWEGGHQKVKPRFNCKYINHQKIAGTLLICFPWLEDRPQISTPSSNTKKHWKSDPE